MSCRLSGCGHVSGCGRGVRHHHKTVKNIIEAHQAGERAPRKRRGRNFDPAADLVAERLARSPGRISAKRLLPAAQAVGYEGSSRNLRRLAARVKAEWRRDHHRRRRPGVWTSGETLIIDWAVEAGLHLFWAVLAWSRFRFVPAYHADRPLSAYKINTSEGASQ
jgi:hypothetical protein